MSIIRYIMFNLIWHLIIGTRVRIIYIALHNYKALECTVRHSLLTKPCIVNRECIPIMDEEHEVQR